MERKFKEELESLIKSGMPKELAEKYFEEDMTKKDFEKFISGYKFLPLGETIENMFVFYVRENMTVGLVHTSYLRVCIKNILKIDGIEETIRNVDFALRRTERIRSDNSVNENYKQFLERTNIISEDLLLRKSTQLDVFCNELRDGAVSFPTVSGDKWPEVFVSYIVKRYGEVNFNHRKSLSKGVEARVDFILYNNFSEQESVILKKNFGLDGCEKSSIDEISLELNIPSMKVRLLRENALKKFNSPEILDLLYK